MPNPTASSTATKKSAEKASAATRVTDIVRTDSQSQRLESYLTRPGRAEDTGCGVAAAALNMIARKRKADGAAVCGEAAATAQPARASRPGDGPQADMAYAAATLLSETLQAANQGAQASSFWSCQGPVMRVSS